MSVLHSSFRGFAALLLLVGVMLGGAIDAAACEPELQASSFVDVHASEQDQDTQDQGTADDDGACVHGHCHHGTSSLAKMQDIAAVGFTAAVPIATTQSGLVPVIGNTPKRPPRA